jgi:hypothetical protein
MCMICNLFLYPGKYRLVHFIFILLLLSFLQCNNKPTPPDDDNHYVPSITLTAEDIGVTDVWLKVKFVDTTVNRSFKLMRDGQTVLTHYSSLPTLDTTIFDDNLLPNHTYNYKALRLVDSIVIDSALLTVPTMDTTSHNFTWEIDTLGDGNNSILRDVCIINDTCVWVVGEIYKKDSTGQFDTQPYGAARWNGNKWEYKKIPALGPTGYTSYLIPKGIFAFGINDIWIASGGIHRFNGQNITNSFWVNNFPSNPSPILDPGQTVEKVWGTSSSDLYIVGNQGAIAHYNGSSWQKIESGTTLPITDIWGAPNKITGEWEILAVASNKYLNEGKQFLRIIGNSVISLPDSGLPWSLSGIWFSAGHKYFIVGDGVYPANNFISSWRRDISFPSIYKDAIRGMRINNIAISGSNGLLSHFNGSTWKHYMNSELPSINGRYWSVAISQNIIIAVGELYDPINSKGIVIIGRR